MPELPEVETMRRGILGIVGRKVRAASRWPCRRQPIAIRPRIDAVHRRVRGQRVVDVQRRGKRIAIELTGGQWLVIEPRMTGLVVLDQPPGWDHVRFCLELTGGERVLFWDRRGLGQIALLKAAEFERAYSDDQLGVDALVITSSQLSERLATRQVAIKVGLLDQRAVAGIGNIYAAEILHLARIDPRAPCRRLTDDQWQRVHRAMRRVLAQAIRCEGSTLGDGTYRNGLGEPGRYQNYHRVYGREGLACRQCRGGRIQRIVQAQRSTFFCPRCQT
jgi:formamidopyrimidine-DNA glycosylase